MLISQKQIPRVPNLEKYAREIKKLRDSITKSTNTINIQFDKDVIFIHPLFIIQLFNFYEYIQRNHKYIKILIDITKIDIDKQPWILNFLAQYIDYGIINLVFNKNISNYIYSVSNPAISIYHSTYSNYKNLTLSKNTEYNFLPITRITPFEHKDSNGLEIKYSDLVSGDDDLVRKKYYDYLQVEDMDDSIETNKIKYNLTGRTKSEYIFYKIFDTYLNILDSNQNTFSSLKDILAESVANIKKHTQDNDSKASGHISFYKNEYDKQYEFIVADNYHKGFLDSYLKTMEIEIQNTEKDSLVWKGYNGIIKDLKAKKYKNVLENIFNLEYIFDAQTYRIVKHFGMPLLLKLLLKFDKQPAYLHMYISNKDGDSFKVIYSANEDDRCTVIPLEKNSIEGTSLHIVFPLDAKINDMDKVEEPLILNTSNYREVFTNKNKIYNKVKLFESFQIEQFDKKVILSEQTQSIIIDFEQNDFTLSDFLREIYKYAYLNSVKDVIIINFSFEDDKNHIELFLETSGIIQEITRISNIIFMDKTYPKVMFIGGKSKEEFEYINYKLSQTYNYDKTNYGKRVFEENEEPDVEIDSNLFFKNQDNKDSFIPLELFFYSDNNRKEYLYSKMIWNYLDIQKNNMDLHVDTKYGFHLKKFYYFKNIFENSMWVNRIAFHLAALIEQGNAKYYNNIIFIGVEKYSSFILSTVKYYLGIKEFNLFSIYDLPDGNIKQFESFAKEHNDKKFIFLYPVISDKYDVDNYLKYIKNYALFSIIKIDYDSIESINKDIIYLFKKNINSIIEPKTEEGFCTGCFLGKEKPLYEIDKDRYNIKNIFTDEIKNINIDSNELTEKRNMLNLNWHNAIVFGHIERGTNHYLYYIKSNCFFINNQKKIIDYVKKLKSKLQYPSIEIPIILSPNHTTNSNFISLIDSIIFNNNAIIHTFDLNSKEQNLHNLRYLQNKYHQSSKYKFFFVDDTISSGGTLEYFHTLLKQLNSSFELEAVFTMIDRTSLSYKSNVLIYFTKKIYNFTTLLIKPIKTGFEECYLCNREKELKALQQNSSLVFIKDQFAQKSKKLQLFKAFEIEYDVIKQIDDFKSFLKTYAVQFIYQNIEIFDTDSNDNVKNLIGEYTNDVKKYFSKVYINSQEILPQSAIDKLINFEAKIAFIKTLAYPKILFFEKIREQIHNYIIQSLRNEILEDNRRIKVNLEPILTNEDVIELSKYHEIKDIALFYKEKRRTQTDYINFLISTGAYLNINYIISYDLLEYYTKLTLYIKDNYNGELYKKYKKLLRVYPVAMKMVVSFSQEKSDYFDSNLKQLDASENRIKYEGKYSRIFGLYIENNYSSTESTEFIKTHDNENKDFNIFLNKLKLKIKTIISNSMKTEKISFYIDANENKSSIHLIDIFHESYNTNNDIYVNLLYYGAKIKTSDSYDSLELEESLENETNIWSNFYKNSYTYIRITNNELNPIGIIKILHIDKKNHLFEHLKVSKNILKFQTHISEYLKKHSLTSQLRYQAQLIQYEVYRNILGNLKHTNISLRRLLNGKLDNFTKEEIYDYTLAANYKNLINILELKDSNHNRLKLAQVTDEIFIANIMKYYNVYQKFQNKFFYELNMEIITSIDKNFTFKLTEIILRSIVFELIDNAFAHKTSKIINSANKIVYNVKTYLLTYGGAFYILNEGTDDSVKNTLALQREIFNFGYSTKNTGYGLYFIKQILNRNKVDIIYVNDLPQEISKGKNITFALQIKEKR